MTNLKVMTTRGLSSENLKRIRDSRALLLVPLVLSGVTHLWNPIGFPSIYVDEGHYIRRALQVLEGNGHQEPSSAFSGYHPYDHPYLGQILLAFMLKIVGYPSSLDPLSGEVSSIEMLHLVPRILMGLLAVVDTYLVYKISLLRYNRSFALAASILFAVMPMTWLVRRILLDSLVLPLLLSSILFAVRFNVMRNKDRKHNYEALGILSGIFLGLAIFTKIPAVTMIPLVGYLVFTSANNKKRTLGIWFIPVILIPAIWPAYAILYGQFDLWIDGVFWQANRIPRSIFDSINAVFQIDPVLITLGMLGVIWTTIKRDFFYLLWILPYLLFLGLVGYSQYIHMALLLPLFSMAAAFLIQNLSIRLRPILIQLFDKLIHEGATKSTNPQRNITSFLGDDYVTLSRAPQRTDQSDQKRLKNFTRFLLSNLCLFVLAVVTIFGLTNTITLITTNVNGSLFESYAALVDYLPDSEDTNQEEVTLVSSVRWGTIFYWIPKFVLDKELTFLDERYKELPSTEMVITVGDKNMRYANTTNTSVLVGRVNNTATHFEYDKYPYGNMRYNELGDLDVRGNY